MISMNQIWDDSLAFIRRESALLVPLAMATIYLADVIATLATTAAPSTEPNPLTTILFVAAALWSVVGQLAIVSLVLKPGQSVREALVHALSRLGKVMAIALILGLAISTALLPVAVAAVASGADPATPETLQNLPGWIAVIALAVLGVMAWLGVRLALMNALIVDRNPGIVDALKGGFALTKGIAAQLTLVVVLYAVLLLVLSSAAKSVAGGLFTLIGARLESPLLGALMTALVSALITTAMSVVATVFLATLYRGVRTNTLA
jgi:hypothetical protein